MANNETLERYESIASEILEAGQSRWYHDRIVSALVKENLKLNKEFNDAIEAVRAYTNG